MLGCHEFCGYYEWTFHYVRRCWGQEAVARLWAEAIGDESQQHYAQAAREAGLAGLYRTWVKTGEDESCDWTFKLDEAGNVLRFDMRQCPSKGFLLSHDLNADEDYCDHCMGWTIPLLDAVGVEVWEHEHNHCGQCWATMRRRDRPSRPLELQGDIRRDPRWHHGYLHRWQDNQKQPLLPGVSDAADPCDVLAAWFARAESLAVVSGDAASDPLPNELRGRAGLMTDRVYATRGDLGLAPLGVLVDEASSDVDALTRRFLGTEEARRPLLLCAYLPSSARLDFVARGLPRAMPILPLLIRAGKYVHQPGGPCPTPAALLVALAESLARPNTIVGNGDFHQG